MDYRWLDGLGDGERKAARRRYEGFMKRQVGTRDEILHAALDANKYALGDEGFVAEIEEHVIAARNGTPIPSDRVDTALRPIELDGLRDAVAEAFDLARERRGRRCGVRSKAMPRCTERSTESVLMLISRTVPNGTSLSVLLQN